MTILSAPDAVGPLNCHIHDAELACRIFLRDDFEAGEKKVEILNKT